MKKNGDFAVVPQKMGPSSQSRQAGLPDAPLWLSGARHATERPRGRRDRRPYELRGLFAGAGAERRAPHGLRAPWQLLIGPRKVLERSGKLKGLKGNRPKSALEVLKF